LIGTRDTDCGTKVLRLIPNLPDNEDLPKDTHINFGEMLDEIDWNEADEHTSKADLCIIAGTR